jgi:hypothetical protein
LNDDRAGQKNPRHQTLCRVRGFVRGLGCLFRRGLCRGEQRFDRRVCRHPSISSGRLVPVLSHHPCHVDAARRGLDDSHPCGDPRAHARVDHDLGPCLGRLCPCEKLRSLVVAAKGHGRENEDARDFRLWACQLGVMSTRQYARSSRPDRVGSLPVL